VYVIPSRKSFKFFIHDIRSPQLVPRPLHIIIQQKYIMKPNTADFQRAFENYFEESKPDVLVERQAKNIVERLQWSKSVSHRDDEEVASGFQRLDNLCGTLTLARLITDGEDEVMDDTEVVSINTVIRVHLKSSVFAKAGQFIFRLNVFADIPVSEDGNIQAEDNEKSKIKSQRRNRVRKKLASRIKQKLAKDSYIKTLLNANDECPLLLCEVKIISQGTNGAELEERVDLRDEILEGIHRSTFSLMDDRLDLMELLASLPWLKDIVVDYSSIDNNFEEIATLANRASLQLLEDALFDACEREGENELLEELTIGVPIETTKLQKSDDGKIKKQKRKKDQ